MTTNGSSPHDLLLPEGARLLHIGLMKTGTTSLQNAAAVRRKELFERGVLYPGRSVNHREAMAALMGRTLGGLEPPPRAWKKVRSEIRRDTTRRVLLGHEFVSEADDAAAQAIREELGARAHVVITLRNYAAMLPSAWQQTLKTGRTRTFDSWLRRVLSEDPSPRRMRLERDRLDQGAIVKRWAAVFGPEKVTVVVVDKSAPTLLFDAFEDMLGIERGFLAGADLDGFASNRSMSLHETELLRAINDGLRADQLDWLDYRRWMRGGVVGAMLGGRAPGEFDTKLTLPAWAARRAAKRSARFVEEIGESGVRVVGDLALLDQPVPHTDSPDPLPVSVPVDAAAQAVLGAVRQARAERERAELFRDRLAAKGGPELELADGLRVDEASGRELATALVKRVGHRVAGRRSERGAGRREERSQ